MSNTRSFNSVDNLNHIRRRQFQRQFTITFFNKKMSTRPSTSGSQTLVSSTPAPPGDLSDNSGPEEEFIVEELEQEDLEHENGQHTETEEKEKEAVETQSSEKSQKDVEVEEESKPLETTTTSTAIIESPPPPPPPATIFLTGATGFLGKVVLSELLRQSIDLAIIKIIVLIRTKDKKSAKARFLRELYKSPCFSDLSLGWPKLVQVVEGDVVEERCDIGEEEYEEMCKAITHVIHCAGSNKVSLPMNKSVNINVDGTINVFELARSCPELKQLVVTSSAYASPNKGKPIREEFVPLPLTAKEMMMVVEGGRMGEEKLLMSTGHGHSFGLSKCMAENWVWERMEELMKEDEERERVAQLERIAEMEEERVENEDGVSEDDENGERNDEARGGDGGENPAEDENKKETVKGEVEGNNEESGKGPEQEEEDTNQEVEIPQEKGFSVSIIRPSLLAPSKKYPHPGWCEGDGMFISLMGCITKGALRVLDGDPNMSLNVVPVDEVATKIIQSAFPSGSITLVSDEESAQASSEPRIEIHFAVSLAAQCFSTKQLTETITSYFHKAPAYPGQFNKPKITHIGPKGGKFKLHTTVHQKLPVLAKKALGAVRSDDGVKVEVEKVGRVVEELVLELRRSEILKGRGWNFKPRGPTEWEMEKMRVDGGFKSVGDAIYSPSDGAQSKEDGGENGNMEKEKMMSSKEYLKIVCEGVEQYILLAEKGK
ncbi:male sterility protein-domain-containing protein [Tricladium varicosporioides]|nr:male sterility protein-domain-containing protein [Hymenoscyphus varicosporioides]